MSGILSTMVTGVGVTNVYQVPSSENATVTISIANNLNTTVTVSVGVKSGSTFTGTDIPTENLIEPSIRLDPNTVLERTGIVLGAGDTIAVQSDVVDVSVVVYGITKTL